MGLAFSVYDRTILIAQFRGGVTACKFVAQHPHTGIRLKHRGRVLFSLTKVAQVEELRSINASDPYNGYDIGGAFVHRAMLRRMEEVQKQNRAKFGGAA